MLCVPTTYFCVSCGRVLTDESTVTADRQYDDGGVSVTIDVGTDRTDVLAAGDLWEPA